MKKIRSVVLVVSVAISLGAIAVACGTYTASDDDAGALTGGAGGTGVTAAGGTGGTGGAIAGTGVVVQGGTGGSVVVQGGTGGGVVVQGGKGGGQAGSGQAGSGQAGGGQAGGGQAGSGEPGPTLPGDVLNKAGIPVVAAYSTVRVIVTGYSGPLYQVCKGNAVAGPGSCKGTTRDIETVAGGYADAAAQDTFCSGGSCTITKIYDQSGKKNDLEPSPRGGNSGGVACNPVNATALKVTINGHPAYGILTKPGMGYRAGCTGCTNKRGNGTAVGDEPQTMYLVSSQKDIVDGCCFSFGNAEISSNDERAGTMEAVYFGYGVARADGSSTWGSGVQGGPWVMADIEDCLFAGWEGSQLRNIPTNTPLKHDFVTAIVVGDTADKNGGKGRIALYGGDATTGSVKTMYDGIRPTDPGYVPAKKQGSIILGTGGDTSIGSGGRFFEGLMANGVATKEIIDALQASIVAAGYGK